MIVTIDICHLCDTSNGCFYLGFWFFAEKLTDYVLFFFPFQMFNTARIDVTVGISVICHITCRWSMALMSGLERRTAITGLTTDSFPTFQCTGTITWLAGEMIRWDRCVVEMHNYECFVVLIYSMWYYTWHVHTDFVPSLCLLIVYFQTMFLPKRFTFSALTLIIGLREGIWCVKILLRRPLKVS